MRRLAVVCVSVGGLVAVLDPWGTTGVAAASGSVARSASVASCPWLNQSLAITARVQLLISRMTLAQKTAEMYVAEPVASGPDAGYQGFVPAQPAVCIPALVQQDDSSGVGAGATGVTQLPAEVSLGAAWDPMLARQYGVVNGQEHWAKGIAMALGPGVNIQRDPRWGRNFEMFSEDPFLTAALGSADIEGIQSQRVMADVKHLAAYNEETYRNTVQAEALVSVRALHEIYLPPFYSAVKQANVASIMCSYASLNNQYSCQNNGLLTGIVDGRWGFPGFIRSDGGATHSTAASANAGLDQEHGSAYWSNGQLAAAVAAGEVKLSTINDAVRRILTEMFRFDLFNDPPTGTLATAANSPADGAFARNVAQRGTVLLQNTAHTLPLSTATSSIAVIGPDGTTSPLTTGGGSASVKPPYVVSPLTGITDRAGPAVTVTSYSGSDPAGAAAAAAGAQVAIVFAGYRESEGSDLRSLSLPNGQDAMIEAVAAANPNTIVVLNTGGPVLMPWRNQVKGILEAWYPGQEDGNAIASVLFGDTDPSGHLTETFPARLAQTPTAGLAEFPGVGGRVFYTEGLDVGYRSYDARRVTPLFPFGYGLSYTSFRFSHLTMSPGPVVNLASGPEAPAGQGTALARVSARITNTGSVAGSDVVQLYLGDPSSAGEPPRQLEGFQRVTLMPHQSRIVSFPVTGHALSYFNTAANGWTLPDGRFSVYVGDSSALASLPLHGALNVDETIGSRYSTLTAPATVDPGSTFTATARFVNHGNIPIVGAAVHLRSPGGWKVVRAARQAKLSLAAGQSTTRNFRVTVPETAQGDITTLEAPLSSAGVDGAGDLNATATIQVSPGITVTPSTTTAAAPGQSAPAIVTLTSHLNQAATLALTPAPPPGITISPAPATVSVPPHGTVSLTLTVSVVAGQPPGAYAVPLSPSFTQGATRYALAGAELPATVP